MTEESQNDSLEDVLDDNDNLSSASNNEMDDNKKEISDDSPRGYMTKEAWISAGKDPAEWVSPEVFKERGEHIKHVQALKRDFDNQIKNINLLHSIQTKNLRAELEGRRDNAIETADKDEVKRIDKQLKELDDAEKLITADDKIPVKPPEIMEWEEDNPWCQNPNDPRLIVANKIYSQAKAQGKTNATALRMVDAEIARAFSTKKTDPIQMAESSRGAPAKRDDSLVTMKTLTREEKLIWDTGMFSDEKTFLKAVANDRKGAK